MLTELETLAAHDSRVADLLDTMRAHSMESLAWLSDHARLAHPDGRVETGDLMTLCMSGFVAGFLVAARLGHDDGPSLDELYTLLVGGSGTLRALDSPVMVAGLRRETRQGRRADA